MEMKLAPRFYQNGAGFRPRCGRAAEAGTGASLSARCSIFYGNGLFQSLADHPYCGGRLWLQASQLHDRRPPRRRRSADAGGRTDPECLRTLCGGYQRLQSGSGFRKTSGIWLNGPKSALRRVFRNRQPQKRSLLFLLKTAWHSAALFYFFRTEIAPAAVFSGKKMQEKISDIPTLTNWIKRCYNLVTIFPRECYHGRSKNGRFDL